MVRDLGTGAKSFMLSRCKVGFSDHLRGVAQPQDGTNAHCGCTSSWGKTGLGFQQVSQNS